MIMVFLCFFTIDLEVNLQEVLVKEFESDWWPVPSFSPDGKWVIFNGQLKSYESEDKIWGVNINNKKTKQIMSYSFLSMTAPYYSFDGTEIAFHGGKDDKYRIYRYNFLTEDGTVYSFFKDDEFARFLKVSDSIVFQTGKKNRIEIWIADLKQKNKECLSCYINSNASFFHPFPDHKGKYIAFIMKKKDKYSIVLFDVKKKKARILYTTDVPLYYPNFSPDDKFLVFERNGEIYVINILTKEILPLVTKSSALFAFPVWSPKGNAIACVEKTTKNEKKYYTLWIFYLKGKDIPRAKTISMVKIPLNTLYPVFTPIKIEKIKDTKNNYSYIEGPNVSLTEYEKLINQKKEGISGGWVFFLLGIAIGVITGILRIIRS